MVAVADDLHPEVDREVATEAGAEIVGPFVAVQTRVDSVAVLAIVVRAGVAVGVPAERAVDGEEVTVGSRRVVERVVITESEAPSVVAVAPIVLAVTGLSSRGFAGVAPPAVSPIVSAPLVLSPISHEGLCSHAVSLSVALSLTF